MRLTLWIYGEKRPIEKAQLPDFFTSFQIEHEPTSEADCPLCHLDPEKDLMRCQGEDFVIVDTQKKKGHKQRIMLAMKKHGVDQPKELLEKAINVLMEVGVGVFEDQFCLLSDKFSSTRYHWHIVTSDLDPQTEDYQQMLETPFVMVERQSGTG